MLIIIFFFFAARRQAAHSSAKLGIITKGSTEFFPPVSSREQLNVAGSELKKTNKAIADY